MGLADGRAVGEEEGRKDGMDEVEGCEEGMDEVEGRWETDGACVFCFLPLPFPPFEYPRTSSDCTERCSFNLAVLPLLPVLRLPVDVPVELPLIGCCFDEEALALIAIIVFVVKTMHN